MTIILGAALYRAGRFEEAAHRLAEVDAVSKLTTSKRTSIVYNWIFRAMAHHRLGHTAEASVWLEKAVQELDKPSPKAAQDPASNTWNRRLTSRLLRREAEEFLAKTRQ
jgi:acyl-homoserine lactone acylase PvdQ